MKMGEVHIDEIRKPKEKWRDFPKVKQIISKYEGWKDVSTDDFQMRAAERIYSIITTEINYARNRGKALLYAEIGYVLTLWNNLSDNV